MDIQANSAQFTATLDRAEQRLTSFSSAVSKLGGIAAGGALAGFAEHIIGLGAEIEHSAVKAGITTTAFQQLAFAAKQSGVDSGQLDSALIRMNRSLSLAGTGGKTQVETLRALGLTFKDLKDESPDKQFEILADRISKLASPADRSRAEIVLFGRAGGELGDLIMKGAAAIDAMGKSFTGIMSEETIKNLEEAHKAIDRMEMSFSALAGTLIGKVAPSLTTISDDLTALISGDKGSVGKTILDFSSKAASAGQAMLGWLPSIKVFGQELNPLKMYNAELAKTLGVLASLNAADKINRPAVRPPGFKPEVKDTQAWADESMHKLMAEEEFYSKLDKLTQTDVEHTVAAFRAKQVALDTLMKDNVITTADGAARMAEELDKILPKFEITAKRMKERFKYETDEMEALAQNAAQSIQGAFANFLFDPLHGGLKRMGVEFLQILRKMAADAAAAKIFDALFGGRSGAGGSGTEGLGGILGSLLTGVIGAYAGGGGGGGGAQGVSTMSGSFGSRAEGGLVSAGSSYLVGESGPELFTAASHGIITPNYALQGSGDFNFSPSYHIDAKGADADRIMTVLPPLLAAHGARLKGEMLQAFRRSGLAAPIRA